MPSIIVLAPILLNAHPGTKYGIPFPVLARASFGTTGANVPAVLAEDGCIEYGAAIDAAPAPAFQTPCGPDTFVVIEKWASLQALQAHAAAPHMASYAAKTREHIASRTLHILSPT